MNESYITVQYSTVQYSTQHNCFVFNVKYSMLKESKNVNISITLNFFLHFQNTLINSKADISARTLFVSENFGKNVCRRCCSLIHLFVPSSWGRLGDKSDSF